MSYVTSERKGKELVVVQVKLCLLASANTEPPSPVATALTCAQPRAVACAACTPCKEGESNKEGESLHDPALISLQTYLGVPRRGAATRMHIGRSVCGLLHGQRARLPVAAPCRVLFLQMVA